MEAKVITRPVAYRDGGVELEGYLAYDEAVAARGKAPGVLVFPEWWGLNDYAKSRARQIAQLGYVAFAVDMYGKGVVTTDAKRAGALAGPFYGTPLMASRARAGLDSLLAADLVDPMRVAAIGYCFGGSAALALAFSGAPLVGVVSFHGGLHAPAPEAASRTRAKLLICHGALDPFETKSDLDAFLAALNQGGYDYQFIEYSGAVHAFTNPDADRLARMNGLEGKIAYNAEADRRSWALMRSFLREVFRE
ncbi:MAG: dienelactone hydrolase family protein [Opitutaceae bacterium]